MRIDHTKPNLNHIDVDRSELAIQCEEVDHKI